MSSRTSMKQQIMRQKVLNEEKPQKEAASVTNGSYSNNAVIKCIFNNSPSNNDCLPSLTSTIVGSDKNFDYCKPFMSDTNDINFNYDRNNTAGEDFSILNFDYNEPLNKLDSPYMLQNMYPVDNKYNLQSFNDFSHPSSNIEGFLDSNSYNNQYHNLNNKTRHMGHVPEMYEYQTSFSCPVTADQSSSSYNQRQMINSNPAVVDRMSLIYDEKRTQLKDRSKKESHNRIERKRRDFINQQIIELSNLLPAQMMTEGESKKNKGNILKNSVLYIHHLQSESNYATNYIKEADMAYMLVDSYRKQIQDLKLRLASFCPEEVSSFLDYQNASDSYTEYLMLHDQNRRTAQSINHLSLCSEMHKSYVISSYNKSPVSTLENGSPFKVEPSSGHSSLGSNSLNATHRLDEETRLDVTSHNEMISPRSNGQSSQNCPLDNNNYFSNSINHYRELIKLKSESMEC